MSYILQTNHLTKIIDGKELVTDVNIHVKKGEIYGFLGPNVPEIHTESMIHYLEDYMYCTRKLGLYVQLVA